MVQDVVNEMMNLCVRDEKKVMGTDDKPAGDTQKEARSLFQRQGEAQQKK